MPSQLITDDIPAKFVFLTGLPRAGKTFFSDYFYATKTDSNVIIDDTLDSLICLFKFNKIDRETFLYLFEYGLKKLSYEYSIGRRVNMRPNDQSSLFNSNSLPTIVENLGKSDAVCETEFIQDNSGLKYQVLAHSALAIAPDLVEKFPDAKIINIFSDPYSLALSWVESGYGSLEIYQKTRLALPLISHKGIKLPIYCINWENEFIQMSEVERVIGMICILFQQDQDGYKSLPKRFKNNLQLLSYQNILENFENLDSKRLDLAEITMRKAKYYQNSNDIKNRLLISKDINNKKKCFKKNLDTSLKIKLDGCLEIYKVWKTNELQLL